MTFSACSLVLARSRCGLVPVLARCAAAPGGALHRPRPDVVAGPLEEQLRAGAGDDVPAEVEVGVVGAALAECEVAVELVGSPRTRPASRTGQVALVGLAGGDVLPDPGDGARVLVGRPVGRHGGASGRRSPAASDGTGVGSSQSPNHTSGMPTGAERCTAGAGPAPPPPRTRRTRRPSSPASVARSTSARTPATSSGRSATSTRCGGRTQQAVPARRSSNRAHGARAGRPCQRTAGLGREPSVPGRAGA